jgi:hypothetical protein
MLSIYFGPFVACLICVLDGIINFVKLMLNGCKLDVECVAYFGPFVACLICVLDGIINFGSFG